MIYSTAQGLLAALHLEFVTSSNKQKKPSFEVPVWILARIHAPVLAVYLGILKYNKLQKQLNCSR